MVEVANHDRYRDAPWTDETARRSIAAIRIAILTRLSRRWRAVPWPSLTILQIEGFPGILESVGALRPGVS
jgi:hypothetical protein